MEYHPPRNYSPLADSDEIRLLLLHPGSGHDTIKCTIQHAKLSDKPQYEALSYMWGPKTYRLIEIDGRTCDVRENLYQALRHLRLINDNNDDEEEPLMRILWIDAICINQNDIDERNHQVTQMGAIYKNALWTVVWLGLAESSTSECAALLNKYIVSIGTREERMIDPSREKREKLFEQPTKEWEIRFLYAIKSLCLRAYWTRLWIIQEILLAPEVLIQCGRWSFTLADLSFLFIQLQSHVLPDKPPATGIGGSKMLHDHWMTIKYLQSCTARRLVLDRGSSSTGSEPRAIIHLSSQYGSAGCEDRRDKIFGLLGVSSLCCREAVHVDYSSSFGDITQKALIHHISSPPGTHKRHHTQGDVIQLFHEQLKITPNDCQSIPAAFLESIFSSHISLFERGAISYISPLLDSDLDVSAVKFPAMSAKMKRQLKSLHRFWTNTGFQLPSSTWETDLILPLDPCPGGTVRIGSLDATRLAQDTPRSFCPLKNRWKAEKACFAQLLIHAQEAVSKLPHSRCRLAFEHSGLICLVPHNAARGDLICQRENSSSLLLVCKIPKSRPKCHLVGRAVNLFAEPAVKMIGSTIYRYRSTPKIPRESKILLNLDFHTRQLINIVSATPNPSSAIAGDEIDPVELWQSEESSEDCGSD
jgi:hypothetical protein